MNPGRPGCPSDLRGMPVQVWATWFPPKARPQTIIQGYPLEKLQVSAREHSPFRFRVADNEIGENFCRGVLNADGHEIAWDVHYRSSFRCTLSHKGWIGFSRTPHSDAAFSGEIVFDGQKFAGDPIGFGVQGHNCGYRHRSFWRWTHAYFIRPGESPSTLEALVYDMPFGLVFRKAVVWHDGKAHTFRNLSENTGVENDFRWSFRGSAKNGLRLEATIDGSNASIHRLPYLKTDCSGSFEVMNNSLARASLYLKWPGGRGVEFETESGAVLEMVGNRSG
jgi:hypothetical protein